MRAVQITLLFVAAMLWLGVQAAQTEPGGDALDGTASPAMTPVTFADAG